MSAGASRILRKNRSGRYGVPSEQPLPGSRKVSLSPKEVRNRKFHQSLTGYDAKEVSLFLKDVALELEKISMQNIHLSEANKALDRQVAQLRVKISLSSDKGTGSGRDAGSHDRQDALLHEARLKAEEIVRQAKMEAVRSAGISGGGSEEKGTGVRPGHYRAGQDRSGGNSAFRPGGGREACGRQNPRSEKRDRGRTSPAPSRKQKPPRRRYCRRHRRRHEALEAGRSEAAWKQSKEFSRIITSQAKKEADEILNAAREEAGQILRKAALEAEQHGEKLVDETRKSAVGRSKKFISEAERQAEEILLLAREEAEKNATTRKIQADKEIEKERKRILSESKVNAVKKSSGMHVSGLKHRVRIRIAKKPQNGRPSLTMPIGGPRRSSALPGRRPSPTRQG